jgi:hypothetical protein
LFKNLDSKLIFFIVYLAPCVALYAQCGGKQYTGATDCCSGTTCQYGNDYYSQCLPAPGPTTSSTKKPGDDRRDGVTTRYWDCCKASCAWNGKASVTNPVKTCQKDGVTQLDINAQSGCNGGPAYMCNNQQPWNVSSTLSYGYAAAHISVSSNIFIPVNFNVYY